MMNANELAACLDMRVVYGLPLAEAAAMLREQQRTIDGDKRLINLLYEKERQQQETIEHQNEEYLALARFQKSLQAEIEALKAHLVKEQDESFDRTASHMAGEYVSWTSCVACGQRVTGDSIHTCSPQLKQLTDEEILREAYYILMREQQRKAQEK